MQEREGRRQQEAETKNRDGKLLMIPLSLGTPGRIELPPTGQRTSAEGWGRGDHRGPGCSSYFSVPSFCRSVILTGDFANCGTQRTFVTEI